MLELPITNLDFSYGKVPVLTNFNCTLTQGVTALLGPNGAGKSTLMKLLIGILKPKRGSISTPGKVGYLEQQFTLQGTLTCARTAAYAAWVSGVSRTRCADAAATSLAAMGLTDRASSRVHTLSGGQRQRLGIACAIAGNPDVVILDEPTVGVDPAQRIEIRRHLTSLAEQRIVLVSTHLVDDAVNMADRILVLNAGRIIFDGTVADLEAAGEGSTVTGVSQAERGYLTVLEKNQAVN